MPELSKSASLAKIEFWAVTCFFVFRIFFFILDSLNADTAPYESASNARSFEEVNMAFSFYRNNFTPRLTRYIALYMALIPLNFAIIPKLLKKQSLILHTGMLLFVFVALATVYGITGTWLQGYRYAGHAKSEVDMAIFSDGVKDAFVVLWTLTVYTAIKYAGIYLLTVSAAFEAKYRFVRKEATVAAVIWTAGVLFLRFARAETNIIICWMIIGPSAIGLYLYSFYKLIPRSLARSKNQFLTYVFKCAVILFIVFLAVYIASLFITSRDDAGAGYSAFNAFFQLFVTVPVSWLLYKRHLKENEQIAVLQKELTISNASIDFLRSQINPHFLFNALNTIYGTAIQERAEKTSEGIQKLGDMMRFMLRENMQDKIPLTREIDYLNNYISLQKLRTAAIAGIKMDTVIEEGEHSVQIAPMLLIPFAENAFKHGISFREPSRISITLSVKNEILYFEVYNSKHVRQDNDPEREKSGIGLENVQQRLQLLYPGKHSLIIQDTIEEFSVQLTVQLQKPNE